MNWKNIKQIVVSGAEIYVYEDNANVFYEFI